MFSKDFPNEFSKCFRPRIPMENSTRVFWRRTGKTAENGRRGNAFRARRRTCRRPCRAETAINAGPRCTCDAVWDGRGTKKKKKNPRKTPSGGKKKEKNGSGPLVGLTGRRRTGGPHVVRTVLARDAIGRRWRDARADERGADDDDNDRTGRDHDDEWRTWSRRFFVAGEKIIIETVSPGARVRFSARPTPRGRVSRPIRKSRRQWHAALPSPPPLRNATAFTPLATVLFLRSRRVFLIPPYYRAGETKKKNDTGNVLNEFFVFFSHQYAF